MPAAAPAEAASPPVAPAATLAEVHILDTGYCTAREDHLIAGGRPLRIACHALVALLRHPRAGWLLWDTGYAPRMWEATRRLPYRLYRAVTPLHIPPGQTAVEHIRRLGLSPGDIGTVVLSHLHGDHLAGLRDFPSARLVLAEEAWDDARYRRGLAALRRAFLPSLLPEDFAARAMLLPAFDGPPLGPLGPTHDLFGDGSARLVRLPGHAWGHLGMLARTPLGRLFFVGDACYHTASIRERRPPGRATDWFADDPQAVRQTIQRLHTWSATAGDTIFVPTHCPEAYARFAGGPMP